MRIIAGKFKGKKLVFPQNKTTRPTADMVKEAIFAKIFDAIPNAVFLDAFCGSGQIGLEALSRGARKVCFVDGDIDAIKFVKENIKNLGVANFSEVYLSSIIKYLNKSSQVFDIVFLDPPYDYKDYILFFETIKNKNLLSESGMIICEHSRDLDFQFEGFEKFSLKQYGIKAVSYFTKI